MRNPFNLFGMDVLEYREPQIPKVELSEDCPCSDECRDAFNLWLIDRFGYKDTSILKPGYAYLFGNTILAHPQDIARFNSIT